MEATLEKTFKLKENGTNVKTEVLAGITSFMTMAYILVVNPLILSETGMDYGGVFTATAVSAVFATLIMAFAANYPFVLAPGMGLNAYFAYTVVLGLGYSWQAALTAVFLEGIVFIILSLTSIREQIVNAIPLNLKKSVSAGIGLFVAFTGLVAADFVKTGDGTITGLADLTEPTSILVIIGILITGILLAKNIKGAILWGILITTVIGIPMGVTAMPEGIVSLPPSLSKVALQLDFANMFSFEMMAIMLTFLFVDLFDTLGTLIGVASKADMLDENGQLPRIRPALLADAIGTTAGALLGTSTVTTFVESASGVAEGGRTGLTALTASLLFVLALFFAPIFSIIPPAATAPALVMVGLFMLSDIGKVEFDDMTEGLPAFLSIIMMPFAYSIAEGIVFGIVSYTVLKLATGKRKDVSGVMVILTVLFIFREIMPLITG